MVLPIAMHCNIIGSAIKCACVCYRKIHSPIELLYTNSGI